MLRSLAIPAAATLAASAAIVAQQYNEFSQLNECSDDAEEHLCLLYTSPSPRD